MGVISEKKYPLWAGFLLFFVVNNGLLIIFRWCMAFHFISKSAIYGTIWGIYGQLSSFLSLNSLFLGKICSISSFFEWCMDFHFSFKYYHFSCISSKSGVFSIKLHPNVGNSEKYYIFLGHFLLFILFSTADHQIIMNASPFGASFIQPIHLWASIFMTNDWLCVYLWFIFILIYSSLGL